jgi:V-type H+-transporting ATPase subunit D
MRSRWEEEELLARAGPRGSRLAGPPRSPSNCSPPQARFRAIAKQIYELKKQMRDDSATAFFSLTQAQYAAGDFRTKVIDSQHPAAIRVHSRTDNVAGVKLPVFSPYDTGLVAQDNIGLAGGGKKVQQCRQSYKKWVENLVKLASLQTSFVTMDEALKVTNRRVNALENVTIPRIEGVISYITRELDELEREVRVACLGMASQSSTSVFY